jgi:hypothetical protein
MTPGALCSTRCCLAVAGRPTWPSSGRCSSASALTNGIVGEGRPFYRAVVDADLEGVVAKRLGNAHHPKAVPNGFSGDPMPSRYDQSCSDHVA